MTKPVLIVFGTRPEAIKMAPVVHAFRTHQIPYKICITAQHRSMLDQVMSVFDMHADIDLNLMKADQTLNQLAASVISHMDDVINTVNPCLVLVHGDTSTSTFAALAAFHKGIKVGHVEAGLRTYQKDAPFPEELNRQLTGRIADFHFAPTQLAATHLRNEGVKESQIVVTGNTVIDALIYMKQQLESGLKSTDTERIKEFILPNHRIILVTGHRRENFGEGFSHLCQAIYNIAETHKDVEVVYPVHLNPNVREPVYRLLKGHPRIHLIDPIDYPAMITLMQHCYMVLTDSGGIQEEAPTFGKPIVLMRETTERPEGIEAGCVILTGTNQNKIESTCNQILSDVSFYKKMSEVPNPFGDGKAADRIAEFVIKQFHD